MTRTTNARVAGFAFLFYIAVGITQVIVGRSIPAATEIASRLANLAGHASVVHVNMLLGLVTAFTALTLAVALYGITRSEDEELAMLGMACRLVEGALIVVPLFATLGLLSLARGERLPGEEASAHALAAFLFEVRRWNVMAAALFFAAGSTVTCWLLLRGRAIPVALAWLGVVSSLLLVVGLPLQMIGVLSGRLAMLIWIPMAAFEIPLGVWLLVKGVAPARASPAPHVTA